ncbi:perlucin-like protein [Mercenaria mercenaria]|uniref:perlucin-like protein n=1 Tax=Mercenaria mercenaria TaxID=6596 RepID=UPI001E1D2A81|nr:perlucin-like protein [Mercenaria mercenaria]
MECSLVVILYLFLTHAAVEAGKWTLFRRMDSLDGKVCEGADTVFSKQVAKDKNICLLECVNHVGCESIFYVQTNGICVGCTVNYETATLPTGLAAGSIYYGHANCPEGWFIIDNSCYFIPDQLMNFEDSVAKCESLNAHVVIIDNVDENNSLKAKLMTSAEDVTGYFIAFTDIVEEGTWTVYGTTDPITFLDWAQNEPTGGSSENCMALYVYFNLQWVDIRCNLAMKTICEKEILN